MADSARRAKRRGTAVAKEDYAGSRKRLLCIPQSGVFTGSSGLEIDLSRESLIKWSEMKAQAVWLESRQNDQLAAQLALISGSLCPQEGMLGWVSGENPPSAAPAAGKRPFVTHGGPFVNISFSASWPDGKQDDPDR